MSGMQQLGRIELLEDGTMVILDLFSDLSVKIRPNGNVEGLDLLTPEEVKRVRRILDQGGKFVDQKIRNGLS